MSELEALNMLLRLIGSSPVSSVDTNHPDVANAMACLTRNNKKAQKRGWWFNTSYNVMYSPDVAGNIIIPSQILSVLTTDVNIVKRGTKLYNNYTSSFTFSETVTVIREIRLLEWEDLPSCMQEFIVYTAGAEFVRDELEDPNKEASLKQDAGLAMIDIKTEELKSLEINQFHVNRIARARAGVRPARLSRFNRPLFGE